MEITDNTPIVMLTVGQLKAIIRQEMEQSELRLKEEKSEEVKSWNMHMVYVVFETSLTYHMPRLKNIKTVF
jgi:hypothetical protein